jgi:predicted pyridoxine 5'-phosphate oxidase superfamily flavin-nucleotide-binding protein
MANRYAEIVFTETIKDVQRSMGSRSAYARSELIEETFSHELGPEEADFISRRDSFYMATVSETGWPYIQHRGGQPGFIKVLDEKTLGFADLRGNRQYISVGNLLKDDRVSLFFMDYRNKRRLKLLGHARTVPLEDSATIERLRPQNRNAKIERGMIIQVEAFEWNCPQHITERFTLAEVEAAVAPLKQRIAALEARLAQKER